MLGGGGVNTFDLYIVFIFCLECFVTDCSYIFRVLFDCTTCNMLTMDNFVGFIIASATFRS